MSKGCIRIDYSWGESEEPIPCEVEDAWSKMVELTLEESRVCTSENDHEICVHFFPEDMSVMIAYIYDHSFCWYTYK